ncbi:MAG: hypothetical protein ACREUA_06215, partial [Burkholderiales bacterium]
AHLYDEMSETKSEKNLLILLSYAQNDSLGILSSVIPVLSAVSNYFERVQIKPHHSIKLPTARALVENTWPEAGNSASLEWIVSPLSALFNSARIVVAAHSGSALEAVCRGIPVIIVGRPTGITMNPLAGIDKRMWEIAYDADQLVEILRTWSPEHPVSYLDRVAIGREIRDAYFQPVNEATMRAFTPEGTIMFDQVAGINP